jgi:NADH-quinone oxidoreductase subunit L
MLVPLGVLAVGSVLAGMVWYNSFFGDHARMTQFFGMPHVEAQAAGAAPAHGAAAPAAEAGHAAALPGQGALYVAADNHVLDDAHHALALVKAAPFLAMTLGLALAFLFYILRPDLPGRLAAQQRPLYLFLLNKWYFDEIYDAVFVRPAKGLGRLLWKRGDGSVIDGTINGVAMGVVPFFTRLAARAQSGYLFHYAFAMVLGLALLVTWITIAGGGN